MTDPYKVLGVTRDASDEKIKEAYRELVKKYHPDNYQESHVKELAEEKMKEINEAYDEIQRQRSSGNSGGGFDFGSGFNNYSSSGSYGGNEVFRKIREQINAGNYYEAQSRLENMSQDMRNAEWNYLMGCVKIQGGYYYDAQKYIQTAIYMDPTNAEYKQMLERLKNQTSSFGSGYRAANTGGSCTACDMCSGLICADCICECCGGDLIRCC